MTSDTNPVSADTPAEVVWIDGRLLHTDDPMATVPFDDHGITVGDGIFETILVRHGTPFALGPHLDRLERSAGLMGLHAPDRAQVAAAVDAVCAGSDLRGPRFLRVTVTAGNGPLGSPRADEPPPPRLIVAMRPGEVRVDPTDVAVGPWIRNERSPLTGVKSTSYGDNVVALAAARVVGCTETLFANGAGHLCEGTGSNVIASIDGQLVTPPVTSGCLPGVTRALCLELAAAEGDPIVERDLSLDDVERCDGMALVSTGREVQPIQRLRFLHEQMPPTAPLPFAERFWVASDLRLDPAEPLIGRLGRLWRARFGPAG